MGWLVLPPKDRGPRIAEACRFLDAVFPGLPVRVKWEIARPDKTPKQNRYLWAVPYKLLSEHTGYSETELHEYNCGEQWGWKEEQGLPTPANPSGIRSVPVRTTTRDENGNPDPCSAEAMTQLWERMQRYGAGIGVFIPDPDPDYLKNNTGRTPRP